MPLLVTGLGGSDSGSSTSDHEGITCTTTTQGPSSPTANAGEDVDETSVLTNREGEAADEREDGNYNKPTLGWKSNKSRRSSDFHSIEIIVHDNDSGVLPGHEVDVDLLRSAADEEEEHLVLSYFKGKPYSHIRM